MGAVWTLADGVPLGQPVASGRVAIVYLILGGALSIEAVNATTGAPVWHQPAATGNVAPGVALEPAVIDHAIVFLRPAPSMGVTEVAVVDAATGRSITSFGPVEASNRPYLCGTTTACVPTARPAGLEEINVDTGAKNFHTGDQQTGRRVGPDDLFDAQDHSNPTHPSEVLYRQTGTKTLWSIPIGTLFGSGYSTNGGWTFYAFPHNGAIVGTVNRAPSATQPAQLSLFNEWHMAGINLATGAKLWSQSDGVDYTCLQSPALDTTTTLASVRCRWGQNSILQTSTNSVENPTVHLEGFNATTGATTWTVPLAYPANEKYDRWIQSIRVTATNQIIAPTANGIEVIDPETGKTSAANAATQAICTTNIVTAIPDAAQLREGQLVNSYATGQMLAACTPGGAPSPGKPIWPSWAGVTAGNLRLITTISGLAAYPAANG